LRAKWDMRGRRAVLGRLMALDHTGICRGPDMATGIRSTVQIF